MIYDLLFDWQKKIVDKYKERDSLGLYLDMGLGKTPISLAFAEQNNCSRILIITINSKAEEPMENEGSWYWWIKKNGTYNIHSKKVKCEYGKKDALVINYESLYSRKKSKTGSLLLKDEIKEFIENSINRNVCIIVDECHKMKNLQSLQTRAIYKIKQYLYYFDNYICTYLLSGTPFTNGYIDLYSQLKFLGSKMVKSEFIERFCVRGSIPGLLGWQQPIIGYKNLDSLYELIHKYAITIKSEEVIDLPSQVFINHVTPASEEFKLLTNEFYEGNKIYKYSKDKKHKTSSKINNPYYRNIDYPGERRVAETASQFWMRARQISIGFQGNADESKWFNKERINKLKEFLKENEDNYVLFYNYTPELLELYDVCEELGYNVDVYCGEVKSLYFYNKYMKLNENEKITNRKNIILTNFASGSTGMNWQEYNKCIIFSIPVYKDYAQGIKRVHRTGQKNTVIYHIFYEDNWLDKGMRKSLDLKVDYNEKMFEKDISEKIGS